MVNQYGAQGFTLTAPNQPSSAETDLPDKFEYLLPVVAIAVFFLVAFLVCQLLEDNSWVDVAWGPSFVVPQVAIISYRIWWRSEPASVLSASCWLNLSLVSVWAIRLAIHIIVRHDGEDCRYHDMRLKWMGFGKLGYYWRSFLFIFMLQALFSLVANSASLFTTIYSR